MTLLLDGRAVAAEIRAEVAAEVTSMVAAGARPPGLAAVLVGEDPASTVYVGSKERASQAAGFVSRVERLAAGASEEELFQTLDRLNADDAIDGILVQLPLPAGLPETRILARVALAKDVDGFHPESCGRLWLDQPGFAPATPTGIVELLDRSDIEIEGLNAVIVGRSAIVGKPLAALLLRRNATVTLCHSRTRDLAATCRKADLLVAAIGRPGHFGLEHVKPGAIVVDVGINRVDDPVVVERLFPGDADKNAQLRSRGSILVGDVDFTRVAPIAGAITPVPGGVGPLTVACLLLNTLRACRLRQGLADTDR